MRTGRPNCPSEQRSKRKWHDVESDRDHGPAGPGPGGAVHPGRAPVASFSLAVDRDFKDKASGERATDWIPVVAWEARAKFAQQYFHKGQLAVVEGRLQIRDWTDKDGGKRRSAEVIADGIYFAGARSAPPSEGNADEGTLPPPPAGDLQDLDDDGELPF